MALNKQVKVYGVDTRGFLTRKENSLLKSIKESRAELSKVNAMVDAELLTLQETTIHKIAQQKYEKYLNDHCITKGQTQKRRLSYFIKKEITFIKNQYNLDECDRDINFISNYPNLNELYNIKRAKKLKYDEYNQALENEFTKNSHLCRTFSFSKYVNPHKKLKKSKLIKGKETNVGWKNKKEKLKAAEFLRKNMQDNIFESSLVRNLQKIDRKMGIYNNDSMKNSEDIFIIRVYYTAIMDSIIANGFMYNGDKYTFYGASAGQIRNKKIVCVRENKLKMLQKKLTCGLSIDDINNHDNGGGKFGININKYLAYYALNNSATDPWSDFDIDRAIVVPDMSVNFTTKVDYINYETYEIQQGVDREIEIPFMDGCGTVLPSVSLTSFMFRMPWFKGLLTPFDFKAWILEKREERNDTTIGTKIKDVWGLEHDIIGENIQIIFTASQFKLWKYYNSWRHYKKKFKKFSCEACKCNDEADRSYRNASLSYQMLQTLPDMTNEEIKTILKNTNKKIDEIGTSLEKSKEILGIRNDNPNMTWLQKAIQLDKTLLKEKGTQKTLKDVKAAIVKRAKYGTFNIECKYTFAIPDIYAFCEWLFLGIENPDGILGHKDISCRLYSNTMYIDCLRSPHLYMEHAVRRNVINDLTRKWFITNGCYTSPKDTITKVLMNDNDGDTYVLCANKTVVNVARRNLKNNEILSLYYDMKKAEPEIITTQSLQNGIKKAFASSNIGIDSNAITRIWNRNDIIDKKTKKINPDALKVIKLICMTNNFRID